MNRWKKTYTITEHFNVTNASTENILSKEPLEYKPWYKRISFKPFLGMFYVFITSFCILFTSVIVKKLTYVSPGQLSMIRNLGVLAFSLPIAVLKTKDVLGPRKHWFMLFMRSFLGSTALYLNLMAYRFLPLAVASIIMSSVPALVMITARLYLKEPCGLTSSLALVVTIIGVLVSIRLPEIISDPESLIESNSTYYIGLGCSFSCIIILSMTFVSLRKMLDVHFSTILVYFGVIGAIENAVLIHFMSFYSIPRCGWDALLMMMMGVFGFGGHCFLTMAFQVEEAGLVSVMKSSSDIVVSIVLQVIFFDLIPDFYDIGGALLVIMSVSIIGFRKWLINLPKDHHLRKTLRCLML
ncbi:solute carrier family 35 member G1-like [Argiope bruennichi]|uniref:solute carrier family 35 member G1-like n=1 Tax=Argiope bruennichi TaxID=94029 RepID=UPI002493FE56|nr:solute carrier family 35 member G1-like [Argiope bruennichi]XP_055939296.1 solute carrier family 35 member G1-like [Argiope bruennichi]XP_055939297.1 solute carrier family 35 member G1-like [Argiope bruennichi]